MTDSAFYVREGAGERYVATTATTGPWDAKLQHGGPVAALLGTRVERAAVREGLRIAQFALEFLSPVPVATLDLATEVVRPGKKIALWSSRASVAGRETARVSAWVLSAHEGRSPIVRFDEPPPPIPNEVTRTFFEAIPHFPYGDALEWRFTEGGFGELGPATLWTRLKVDVVDGEPVTPLGRVLAMVDSANGASAELDPAKWLFVPVNLTVSLARMPATEWTGMSVTTSIDGDGIGITRARLFDERGFIGEALQTLFVEPR